MKTLSYILLAIGVLALSIIVGFQATAANRQSSLDSAEVVSTPTENKNLDSTEIVSTPIDDKSLIVQTLTRACQIGLRAAATFDISELPTVFANDPRFTVRISNYPVLAKYFPNASAERAGYLDYKIAVYTSRKERTLILESIQQTMTAENRDTMTQEEIERFSNEHGVFPPARVPLEELPMWMKKCVPAIISLEIEDDFAIAVVDEGATTSKHYLVKKNGQWYVFGRRIIKVAP